MLTYDQIQQTIYAIAIARGHVEEQFHQCVRGWGNIETYHSDQFKLKGEKLLELQLMFQAKLDDINNKYALQVLDSPA